MLTRLAEIGMEIAEAVGRQAAEASAEAGEGTARRDPGLVFARVSRAVRMTIALQSRLAKDLAVLDRADDMAVAAGTAKRRMRLRRLVEEAVEAGVAARREAGDHDWDEDEVEDEIEQLSSEAFERLTDAEDGDLFGRPFSEVAAGICKDLGLSPDWTARLLAAVDVPTASRHARSAAPPPDSGPPSLRPEPSRNGGAAGSGPPAHPP